MTDRTWDVVVVGAGPAGSTAARELARRGVNVLLADKATFPRSKVCGSSLNGVALAALTSIGLGNLPAACGAVPMRSMKLVAGSRSADVPLPTGVILSREVFDAALVREAETAGAIFAPDTMVKLDEQTGNEVRSLTLADGRTLSARIVILATGLAGSHSHADAGSRLGAGAVVPGDCAPDFFEPGTIFMATGCGGYVGLVRLEDYRLDIAAAFDASFVHSSGGLGHAAAAILAATRWPAIADLAELHWKGTPALTRRHATLAGHRFFAVGDAAGYLEPFTGEGIAWAIASAIALAPIAHRACKAWDDRFIGEWRRAHTRIVSRRSGICRIASRLLRSQRLTGLAVRMISALPILARPVVATINRPAYQPGFTS